MMSHLPGALESHKKVLIKANYTECESMFTDKPVIATPQRSPAGRRLEPCLTRCIDGYLSFWRIFLLFV